MYCNTTAPLVQLNALYCERIMCFNDVNAALRGLTGYCPGITVQGVVVRFSFSFRMRKLSHVRSCTFKATYVIETVNFAALIFISGRICLWSVCIDSAVVKRVLNKACNFQMSLQASPREWKICLCEYV